MATGIMIFGLDMHYYQNASTYTICREMFLVNDVTLIKMEKAKTLFDHLSGLTDKKTKWEELSELDRKSFSPYMINRFLSMNSDFTEIVDTLQRYTMMLQPREVYKLYLDILPKSKIFFRYIKGSKEGKYNPKLIAMTARHYECSTDKAIEYLDTLTATDDLKEQYMGIISGYGLTEKEVSKLFK